MSIQGFHRFRLVIPVILLCQVFLDRRERRWPSLPIIILGLMFFIGVLPMKVMGRTILLGGSLQDAAEAGARSLERSYDDDPGDFAFLDEFACTLSLVRENGHFFYGRTYLPLVTLPIPRSFWPDKPGLNDYQREISRPWRPVADLGMISTLPGEAYANFGIPGIAFTSFLIAYILSRVYFWAYKRPYQSIDRFIYLIVSCSLIQVYRDGLVSLPIFTLVNMMPLCILAYLHHALVDRRNVVIHNPQALA